MKEVINLIDKKNDGNLWSPEQALQQTINDHGEGEPLEGRRKILILSLDSNEDNYAVSFIQAGLKMSECVNLCEISKSIFKNEIGY